MLGRRRSGHLALLSAVLAVSVFGYFLIPSRTVRVIADGRELVVDTTLSNDGAVVQRVGVDLGPGDRVIAMDGPGADVLRVDRAQTVVLSVDGATYELRTHALTIDQLLDEAGVAITGRDSVVQNSTLVATNAPVVPPRLSAARSVIEDVQESAIAIEVRRAVTFTVDDDGAETVSTSSRPTVALALREAGLQIGPGDEVVPAIDATLSADMRVEIKRARALTVALPDEHRVLYTRERTVGDALAAAGIVLPEGAFVEPGPETAVAAGMSVRVVQLSESNEVEREFIESRTVYRSDSSLGPGETRIEHGHDGALVRRYAVAYVNGEEAGRELVEEYYDPEPADTVIYYPVQTGRDLTQPDEGTVVRTLSVYATYYTPASSGRAPSDPAYGRTATGATVTYGIVAVDPAVIPLGTRMFIPGYGYGVAADTGGAVKGYIIDLGYPDGVDIDWQSRWLDIYILS